MQQTNNIPVGPGRGSSAGSFSCILLQELQMLTPLNIILLFERFLNPERVTMPDIDIDFCIEGREIKLLIILKINMDINLLLKLLHLGL